MFVKSSTELDEQPGPVRDRLRDQHLELARSISRIFAGGIREGHFRADADAERFAGDLHAVMLGFYHQHRLLGDPRAEDRARAAVAALLDAARPPGRAARASGRRGCGGGPMSAGAGRRRPPDAAPTGPTVAAPGRQRRQVWCGCA